MQMKRFLRILKALLWMGVALHGSMSQGNGTAIVGSADQRFSEKVEGLEQELGKTLEKKGVAEIKNVHFSRAFYDTFYQDFEALIEMGMGELLAPYVAAFMQENPTLQRRFCGTPPGFKMREYKSETYHQDDKVYFQYTRPFHEWLTIHGASLVTQHPLLAKVLDACEKMVRQSERYMESALAHLEPTYPGLGVRFHASDKTIPMVLKVIAYQPTKRKFCTLPHVDKSGLSLLYDNSDLPYQESILLAPYQPVFHYKDLSCPQRKWNTEGKDYTSTLLIVGACLKKIGCSLFPTPHGVLCSGNKKKRFSVVVFGLVPDLDTKDITTTIVEAP